LGTGIELVPKHATLNRRVGDPERTDSELVAEAAEVVVIVEHVQA
jgi:hypothetical protein